MAEGIHDRKNCAICRRLRGAVSDGVIACPRPDRWGFPPLCEACSEWNRAGCHIRLVIAEQSHG